VIANGRIATNTVCCLWRAGHAVTTGPCSVCVAAGDVWISNTNDPYRPPPLRPPPRKPSVRQFTSAPPAPQNRAARRKAAALARKKK
jgi:hypothetical protein